MQHCPVYKLLIIKYEYVQIYDAFVSLNGSHLEKYNAHGVL